MSEKGLPYRISLELSALEESCVRDIECDDGELRKCICLPMEDNFIKEFKKHIYLNIYAVPKVFDRFGQTHFLTIMMTTKEMAKFREERERTKPLGNMSPIFKVDKKEIKKEITAKDL